MSDSFHHVTVLRQETVDAILPSEALCARLRTENRALVAIDCTLGGGGHSVAYAEALQARGFFHGGLRLILLGIDRDPAAHIAAARRLAELSVPTGAVSFRPCQGNFSNIGTFVQGFADCLEVDALMADFGVSSPQLDDATRGFSLQRAGPLDMRMDSGAQASQKGDTPTALELLTEASFEQLTRIFSDYGEEPRSRKLAQAIVSDRAQGRLRASNTVEFAEYVRNVLNYHNSKIHPATRIFQALRIAVNGELDAIESLLNEVPKLMGDDTRSAFISFHSLEDRLVKQRLRVWEKGRATAKDAAADADLTQYFDLPPQSEDSHRQSWGREEPRGGSKAGEAEVKANPRARSARLRVFHFAPGQRQARLDEKV